MTRIIIDYIWISIAITALLALIAHFFPNFGGTGGAVTTVVSAMVTGQLYGTRTGSEVTSGFAWKIAAVLTLVALLMAAAILMAFQLAGVPVLPTETPITGSVWVMVIGLSALVVILITRFSFRWGVKAGAKIAQKNDKSEIFD